MIPIYKKYKNFKIKFRPNHLLAQYQKISPKYDKFLPILAKLSATSADTIIDVGANVGDSLAGMAAENPRAQYICIEPDASFFQHLEENTAAIKKSIPNFNVRLMKELIGHSIGSASLQGEGGTKHAVPDKTAGRQARSLDDIIPDDLKIRILKSDVDGFDYDVVNSAINIIKNQKPILFFECHYIFEEQKNNYTNLLESLDSLGYSEWVIFDNFGEVILKTNNINNIFQLMDYIWQQNIGKTTRTIYYLDILSAQKEEAPLIEKILAEYKTRI